MQLIFTLNCKIVLSCHVTLNSTVTSATRVSAHSLFDHHFIVTTRLISLVLIVSCLSVLSRTSGYLYGFRLVFHFSRCDLYPFEIRLLNVVIILQSVRVDLLLYYAGYLILKSMPRCLFPINYA